MFVDALNEQQPGKVNLFEMQQKYLKHSLPGRGCLAAARGQEGSEAFYVVAAHVIFACSE
jgi:hypothetical protein